MASNRNRVEVIAPDGEEGTIPASELAGALAEGFTLKNPPLTTGQRFLRGLTGSPQPRQDLAAGLKLMATDPATAFSLLAGELPANIIAGHIEQAGKFIETARRGIKEKRRPSFLETLEQTGRLGAALLPVAGPAAANIGESATEGIEGMLAEAGGLITGITGISAAKGTRPGVSRPAGEIPITAAAESGGTLAKMGESIVERSLPGSLAFEKFRGQQQTALLGKVDEFVRTTNKTGLSPEEAGRAAGIDVLDAVDNLKRQASENYKDIDSAAKGVLVKTDSLKKFAADEQARLNRVSTLVDPRSFKDAQAQLKRVAKAPAEVPFSVMQDARSELLNLARRNDSLLGTRGQGAVRKLSGLADQEMIAAAEKSSPELAQGIRQANAFWKDIALKTERTFDGVEKLARERPESLSNLLSTAPLESIRDLRAALRPETWNAVKSNWLKEGLLQSIKGETIRPELSPFGKSAAGEIAVLDPKAFQRWLESQGKRTAGEAKTRLGEIFEPQELTSIENILDISRKVQPAKGGILLPVLNAGLLIDTARAIATADAARLGINVGISASLYAIGKVLTKPGGAVIVRNFLRSAGKAGQIQFWGARLAELSNQIDEKERKKQSSGRVPAPENIAPPEEQ